MTFITQVLNGLQLGSIYALVALGYTMVYGIILLLNFAHGDIIMVGAYISWLVMSKLGLNPAIAVVLSIVGCMLLGVLIDKVAYAPLRDAPRLSILITAIGVSYFLENGSQLLFGADAKVVPAYTSVSNIQVGDLTLSFSAIVTVVVTAVATVVLTFLVQKTQPRQGHARRHRGHGRRPASWASTSTPPSRSPLPLGSALAGGRRSVLYLSWPTPRPAPTMGSMLGLTKAFVAAVLGGIGSPSRAPMHRRPSGIGLAEALRLGRRPLRLAGRRRLPAILIVVLHRASPRGLLGTPDDGEGLGGGSMTTKNPMGEEKPVITTASAGPRAPTAPSPCPPATCHQRRPRRPVLLVRAATLMMRSGAVPSTATSVHGAPCTSASTSSWPSR